MPGREDRPITALDPGLPPLPGNVDDLRTAWREACAEMRDAYGRWRLCGEAASGDEFTAYVAAADREAAAADVLARHASGAARAR
jgi:hypothetical protein